MRRLAAPLSIVLALALVGFDVHAALGATPKRQTTFHVGQSSPVICGVKWMISGPKGHRPNVYTVKGTYTRPLKPYCNYLGKAAGAAVRAYKYRLGYPTRLLKPVVGPYFLDLLHGRKHRPLLWVALAQKRAKAIQPGPTKLALKIIAFEGRQVGTHEQGTNTGYVKGPGGYSVDDIEGYFHLRGLEWCAIFQRFSFVKNGSDFARGYNPYYVPDIGRWAQAHGYLSARARVGSLVAFLGSSNVLDGRHIGMVVRIVHSGYYTIEGNSSNAVTRHYYDFGSALRVFINVPGVV